MKKKDKARCGKCSTRFEPEAIEGEDYFDWATDRDRLSKRYCQSCYDWIVENWESLTPAEQEGLER